MKISSTNSQVVIEWERDLFEVSSRFLAVLKEALSKMPDVQSVRLSGTKKQRIVVKHQSPQGVAPFLKTLSQRIRTVPVELAPPQAEKSGGSVARPATWFRRFSKGFYVFMAYGSFVMAWVGLILPGIPTVPFVILTIYFAEKSSPRLRRSLMESPVIGPVMRDWSEKHAIRRSAKERIFVLMGIMILFASLMMPINSIQFLSMVLVIGLSIYMINRIPVIEDTIPDRRPELRLA